MGVGYAGAFDDDGVNLLGVGDLDEFIIINHDVRGNRAVLGHDFVLKIVLIEPLFFFDGKRWLFLFCKVFGICSIFG